MALIIPILLLFLCLSTRDFVSPTLSSAAQQGENQQARHELRCQPGTCCAGINGVPGTNGIPGRPGPPGPSGPPGQNGLNGIPGSKGTKGDPGTEGRRGRRGFPGINGRNGTDGVPGWRGKEGPRGPMGHIGPAGTPGKPGEQGKPGTPGLRGPPGRVSRSCKCERNVPTQMFFINSGFWISHKHMLGFQNVPTAIGEFHMKVLDPVTYILHVGGDWVNEDSVTLYFRLHCSHRRRVVYLPNETGHKIYKFKEENRLESESFTYVTTSLSQTGRWRCQLQISKGFIQAFYRWDSQYGEISLTMW
ncbi:collagen alpha-1(IV) chain-like [Actinia tenebrosa]|uniref:Collagen alpha-1(IV) chain-like n=1 Tax=Actinia tenebrosa TaxID=6105 RepID=A0A6P8IVX6_ACTTE|nr:collagen alpha-1(IV) chain-like [Actinia tenebrosa]XP_031571467.1 collagen alpha-1(IV) chain-like [Actinia tenebrosa]